MHSQHPLGISWTNKALSDVKRLGKPLRVRILDAIDRYTESGLGDAAKLHGREHEARLRVVNWRVLFRYDEHYESIRILRVLSRGSVYKS